MRRIKPLTKPIRLTVIFLNYLGIRYKLRPYFCLTFVDSQSQWIINMNPCPWSAPAEGKASVTLRSISGMFQYQPDSFFYTKSTKNLLKSFRSSDSCNSRNSVTNGPLVMGLGEHQKLIFWKSSFFNQKIKPKALNVLVKFNRPTSRKVIQVSKFCT